MNAEKTYDDLVLILANRLLGDYDPRPVDNLTDALTVILTAIGEQAMAGTEQIPDPGHCSLEKCSVNACFMAACSVPLVSKLKELNLEVDAEHLMYRTADRVFGKYGHEDRKVIMDSGMALFREMTKLAAGIARMREWLQSVHNVADRYVLTEGRSDCFELFGPLYMVLLMATKQVEKVTQ